MKLTVDSLAEQINAAAPDYNVGGLQRFRSKLHQKRARTRMIFHKATIFHRYAFHDGGRTEMQYNIGFDFHNGKQWWRHGVAFSFEKSQSLPDPLILVPKVERFNAWLRKNSGSLKGFKMSWSTETDGSGDKPLSEIPKSWMEEGAFIFIGKTWRESNLDIHRILQDFDHVYPAYRFVESDRNYGIAGFMSRRVGREILAFSSKERQQPAFVHQRPARYNRLLQVRVRGIDAWGLFPKYGSLDGAGAIS